MKRSGSGDIYYTYLYELAQMYSSKAVTGYNPELEYSYKTKNKFGLSTRNEIDIVRMSDKGNVIWEVKPLGGESPEKQLAKYSAGTGFARGGTLEFQSDGYTLANIRGIRGNYTIKMHLTSNEMGGDLL